MGLNRRHPPVNCSDEEGYALENAAADHDTPHVVKIYAADGLGQVLAALMLAAVLASALKIKSR